MDVLTFETCWALNNEIIKQVTSNWSILIQLNINLTHVSYTNTQVPVPVHGNKRKITSKNIYSFFIINCAGLSLTFSTFSWFVNGLFESRKSFRPNGFVFQCLLSSSVWFYFIITVLAIYFAGFKFQWNYTTHENLSKVRIYLAVSSFSSP